MRPPPPPVDSSPFQEFFRQNPHVLEWLLTKGLVTVLLCATALGTVWIVHDRANDASPASQAGDQSQDLQESQAAPPATMPEPVAEALRSGRPFDFERTIERTTAEKTTERWNAGGTGKGDPPQPPPPAEQPAVRPALPEEGRRPPDAANAAPPPRPERIEDVDRAAVPLAPPDPPMPPVAPTNPVPAVPQPVLAHDSEPPAPAPYVIRDSRPRGQPLSPQQQLWFERGLIHAVRVDAWRRDQERRLAACRAVAASQKLERARLDALCSSRVGPAGQIDWPATIRLRYPAKVAAIESRLARGDARGSRAECDALLATMRRDLQIERSSGFQTADYMESRRFLEWMRTNPPALALSVAALDGR